MVFSSIVFLFYFLPIVLGIYFLVPKKYKNIVLLLSSLFFYSWGEPKYILIMIFSAIVDFHCGKYIFQNREKNNFKKAKLWLIISLISNIGLLAFFKYFNFFLDNINNIFNLDIAFLNIALPIGISFYTFQTMSYTIDVYRGETKIQKSFINFATYVTLFPQLIAGPIVRYDTIANELDDRKIDFKLFGTGVNRFIIGLAQKVLLANNIGLLWEGVSNSTLSEVPTLTAWLGIMAFAFQIYFDFLGYSNMAIGLGNMFGFHFPENFNYPYMSKSISEFWRRWHISLGTWFKKYVYISLGGNRVSKILNIRNLLIVWMLTGFWHGASWNFMFWGAYFGVLLIFEKFIIGKYLEKIPVFFQSFYTLILILISWVIFSFESVEKIINYLKLMFNPFVNGLYNEATIYYFYTNIILFIILIFASTDIPKKIWTKINLKSKDYIELVSIIALFILVIANLVDQTYNPFLYFRF